jgi:excisionase family DNA binding protein
MTVTHASTRLLTLDEVADRLRLSRRTIERMVEAELLIAYRVSRRAVRVDEAELESWIYQDAGRPSSVSAGPQTATRAGEPLARADEPRRGARGDE